jgi:hypothetical protein
VEATNRLPPQLYKLSVSTNQRKGASVPFFD